jgi:hypothetical protein
MSATYPRSQSELQFDRMLAATWAYARSLEARRQHVEDGEMSADAALEAALDDARTLLAVCQEAE